MIFLSFQTRENYASLPAINAPETYKHDIRALGGYRSMQFSFNTSFIDAAHWIHHGLGAGVVAKNQFGQTIWEGFVNQVMVSSGASQREVGPLTEISNRVACTYSTPDYAGLAKSYQKTTDWAEDYISVLRYGYFAEVISGGTKDDGGASRARDRHLEKSAYPTVIDTTSESSQSSITSYNVEVDCAGYSRYLERSVYAYTADYDKQTVKEKMGLVFTRTFFNASVPDYQNDIAYLGNVEGWEDKNRSGWDVVESMVEELGIAHARVGMFSNKTFKFEEVLTDDKYDRDFDSGAFYLGGVHVLNSAVMPGMFVNSSAVGESVVYYVDSVSYDMSGDRIKTNQASRNIQSVLRRAYGAF